jgi:Fe-S cluster biosynthesis and repair protein YggX
MEAMRRSGSRDIFTVDGTPAGVPQCRAAVCAAARSYAGWEGEDLRMGRVVQCVKFGREMPGLDEPPWPGELGQRVFEHVSAEAWSMWKEHAKMILNEYRLAPWTPEAQKIMAEQMEQYFFGEGAQLPPGYTPQRSKS